MLKREQAKCWLVDWSSKKLKRAVRSSVAAETLSGQNGLDAVELFQALMEETLRNVTPRQFREMTPKHEAGLVIDSKGFYDAITRSCCSQAVSVERRLQIDYAIAKETMQKQNIIPFWVNNLRMAADCLTKLKGWNQASLWDSWARGLPNKSMFRFWSPRESRRGFLSFPQSLFARSAAQPSMWGVSVNLWINRH